MKRIRPGRWSGQLLSAARPSSWGLPINSFASATTTSTSQTCRHLQQFPQARLQSTVASPQQITEDTPVYHQYPSPPPSRARDSAKLGALHARLALSEKVPLETVARTLIDRSADKDIRFNNYSLSKLGAQLIEYHVNEWLICRYPRLPYSVLLAARDGYAGELSLADISKSWGVESAAEPGGEVDPGLLQFSVWYPKPKLDDPEHNRIQQILKNNFRLLMKGQVASATDPSEVGPAMGIEASKPQQPETISLLPSKGVDKIRIAREAHSNFVRALVGAVYAHCGREAAKLFINAHILSRHLDLATLFSFKRPTMELARLCAREDFEEPTARILSETGRHSRTPVFVVGIFSGNDKLGEGSGANLQAARANAAMNALKAWYLYSPGPDVRVPSDMLVEGAKPWTPAYVDIGEII
ncbi:hypothetical protein PpBr36_01040 [Pyricularia pennisetigena]|uniref:hypothetical protein n=1 Tax=Pyricularia pennisetigena TaxID=1578925 RepID=UPI0011549E6A|nr:hypothetical protein PpBr36_01040 [Pyricularia pennisetigena]TLS29671.1 hypothetical protein PpBr36_01040 [Pyricularia pennisetigena]